MFTVETDVSRIFYDFFSLTSWLNDVFQRGCRLTISINTNLTERLKKTKFHDTRTLFNQNDMFI